MTSLGTEVEFAVSGAARAVDELEPASSALICDVASGKTNVDEARVSISVLVTISLVKRVSVGVGSVLSGPSEITTGVVDVVIW